MNVARICDISITVAGDEWEFYIPIKTGGLRFRRKFGVEPELDEFVKMAAQSEFRRFGENPV